MKINNFLFTSNNECWNETNFSCKYGSRLLLMNVNIQMDNWNIDDIWIRNILHTWKKFFFSVVAHAFSYWLMMMMSMIMLVDNNFRNNNSMALFESNDWMQESLLLLRLLLIILFYFSIGSKLIMNLFIYSNVRKMCQQIIIIIIFPFCFCYFYCTMEILFGLNILNNISLPSTEYRHLPWWM